MRTAARVITALATLLTLGLACPVTMAQEANAQSYIEESLTRQFEGNYLGALESADEALFLDPTNPAAFSRSAVVKNALGDKAGALEDAQSAAEFYLERGDLAWYKRALQEKQGIQSDTPELREQLREQRMQQRIQEESPEMTEQSELRLQQLRQRPTPQSGQDKFL